MEHCSGVKGGCVMMFQTAAETSRPTQPSSKIPTRIEIKTLYEHNECKNQFVLQ